MDAPNSRRKRSRISIATRISSRIFLEAAASSSASAVA